MATIYSKDFDSDEARHRLKVQRWSSDMIDRIVAMARAAPDQQDDLAELALQTLEEWTQLARPETSFDEAHEYVGASRAAIMSLRDLRITMVGKPTSLEERDTNDPDEIETWRLYDEAVRPIVTLAGRLNGWTQDKERWFQDKIAENDRRRAAEQAHEAKCGFWSKLKFWQK
jgi:hypothetical protein